jgi:hypothetical protein
MKRLLAVLLLLVPESALATPVVSEADLSGTADHAHVELVLTGAPQFHVLYLANPYRIAIDMDAIDWRAAPVSSSKTGLVTGLRYGVPKVGVSRLVLDLATPARIALAHYHTDQNSTKTRFTIDLQAVSAANFQQAMARSQPSPKIVDGEAVEAAAAMTTAAGKPSTPAASRKTQQATTSQGGGDTKVDNPDKRPYPEPLMTSLSGDPTHNQQTSESDGKSGFGATDGYAISYMHPPGSLLGAGVTLEMQF